LTASALVSPAAAQQTTFGVRAGLSADPDQFFIGAQLETPPITSSGRLTVRPTVDVGFGDDVTLLSGGLDVIFRGDLPNSDWAVYFGAGPSINFFKDDFGEDVDGGFNGLVGFRHARGLFVEMKAGAAPSLRVTAGYVLTR
jgi:hypothetical protein